MDKFKWMKKWIKRVENENKWQLVMEMDKSMDEFESVNEGMERN